MSVILPSEQGNIPLSLAQAEAIFEAIFRASVPVTISSDALSLPGSGRYKVSPQTGTSDQITSLTLSTEVVEGCLVQLRPATVGHTISLIHGGNLHLLNGGNVELTTIYTSVWLRHHGANVWSQEGPVSYCP